MKTWKTAPGLHGEALFTVTKSVGGASGTQEAFHPESDPRNHIKTKVAFILTVTSEEKGHTHSYTAYILFFKCCSFSSSFPRAALQQFISCSKTVIIVK